MSLSILEVFLKDTLRRRYGQRRQRLFTSSQDNSIHKFDGVSGHSIHIKILSFGGS